MTAWIIDVLKNHPFSHSTLEDDRSPSLPSGLSSQHKARLPPFSLNDCIVGSREKYMKFGPPGTDSVFCTVSSSSLLPLRRVYSLFLLSSREEPFFFSPIARTEIDFHCSQRQHFFRAGYLHAVIEEPPACTLSRLLNVLGVGFFFRRDATLLLFPGRGSIPPPTRPSPRMISTPPSSLRSFAPRDPSPGTTWISSCRLNPLSLRDHCFYHHR